VTSSSGAAAGQGLVGAYDTHVHAAPDAVPRRQDYLTVAHEAQASGMAGIVFKDVGQPTMDRAYAVRAQVPGLEAFGGVVLDLPVGGLNPHAVRSALDRGGRVIWMPVVHSRQTIERVRDGTVRLSIEPTIDASEGLTIYDAQARLSRTVREIIALIADRDAILATGHLSPRESLDLISYASTHGVTRMIVNHPSAPVVGASVDEQVALAGMGAFLEHCYAQCTPSMGRLPMSTIGDAIRMVGPEHCLLATDLGQTLNEPSVAGLASFRAALRADGCSERDLVQMMSTNPRALFTWSAT
jgi:hypothetical protein